MPRDWPTIELGSGQSFAIAGLMQNDTVTDASRTSGLGDLPVLGTLFRSTRFQRNETELVIVVTPYLVRPVSERRMASPTDGHTPLNDVERIFLGQLHKVGERRGSAGPLGRSALRLTGDTGFMLME